jgi:hypothetical protein
MVYTPLCKVQLRVKADNGYAAITIAQHKLLYLHASSSSASPSSQLVVGTVLPSPLRTTTHAEEPQQQCRTADHDAEQVLNAGNLRVISEDRGNMLRQPCVSLTEQLPSLTIPHRKFFSIDHAGTYMTGVCNNPVLSGLLNPVTEFEPPCVSLGQRPHLPGVHGNAIHQPCNAILKDLQGKTKAQREVTRPCTKATCRHSHTETYTCCSCVQDPCPA